MTTESDGIGELSEDLLRAAMLIGTRVAQRHQQQRAEQLAEAARASQEAAAAERAQQSSARESAIGSLAGVSSNSWWDHADADDIRGAWTTARDYQAEDPRANRAVYRIADELKDRYGFDVYENDPEVLGQQPALPAETALSADELREYDQHAAERLEDLGRERDSSTDPRRLETIELETEQLSEIRKTIAEDLADRQPEAAADTSQQQVRREQSELVDAELLTGTAATAGASAGLQGPYDSAQRREELRERLKTAEVPDRAIDARVLSDMGQAMPAREAVAQGRGDRAQARPAARNPRGRAPSRQRTR